MELRIIHLTARHRSLCFAPHAFVSRKHVMMGKRYSTGPPGKGLGYGNTTDSTGGSYLWNTKQYQRDSLCTLAPKNVNSLQRQPWEDCDKLTCPHPPVLSAFNHTSLSLFKFLPKYVASENGKEKDVIDTHKTVHFVGREKLRFYRKILWKKLQCIFLTLKKNMSGDFFKGIALSLKNSWDPNNLVLSPRVAENCVKRGDLSGVQNQVPENYTAQVSSVQLCWILKFAQEYTKLLAHMKKQNKTAFDKAQIRQNEQLRRDNKCIKRTGRLRTTAKQIFRPFQRIRSNVYRRVEPQRLLHLAYPTQQRQRQPVRFSS